MLGATLGWADTVGLSIVVLRQFDPGDAPGHTEVDPGGGVLNFQDHVAALGGSAGDAGLRLGQEGSARSAELLGDGGKLI